MLSPSRRPYLALSTGGLSPGSGHEWIVDRNTSDHLDTSSLQLVIVVEEAWQVSLQHSVEASESARVWRTLLKPEMVSADLGAARSESAWNGEQHALLVAEKLLDGNLGVGVTLEQSSIGQGIASLAHICRG